MTLREALEEAAAFIEATSIEVAEQDNDTWLRLAAPYYVGYNLGQRHTINTNVSVIERNTERWRDARVDLLARLKATLAEGPTRWDNQMREWEDVGGVRPEPGKYIKLCWAYIADETVCIQKRGHDNNAHEPPEAKS